MLVAQGEIMGYDFEVYRRKIKGELTLFNWAIFTMGEELLGSFSSTLETAMAGIIDCITHELEG